MKPFRLAAVAALAFAVVVGGCGGGAALAAERPTAPPPTTIVIYVTPMPTLEVQPTAAPTTPTQPTDEPIAEPTAEPTRKPTRKPTPRPTAKPKPVDRGTPASEYVARMAKFGNELGPLVADVSAEAYVAAETGNVSAVQAAVERVNARARNEIAWYKKHPAMECYADVWAQTRDIAVGFEQFSRHMATALENYDVDAVLSAMGEMEAVTDLLTGLTESGDIEGLPAACA